MGSSCLTNLFSFLSSALTVLLLPVYLILNRLSVIRDTLNLVHSCIPSAKNGDWCESKPSEPLCRPGLLAGTHWFAKLTPDPPFVGRDCLLFLWYTSKMSHRLCRKSHAQHKPTFPWFNPSSAHRLLLSQCTPLVSAGFYSLKTEVGTGLTSFPFPRALM